MRRPQDVTRYLAPEEAAVYALIWKRTVASQMESARLDQVTVDIADRDGRGTFRAVGSVITFDGFLKLSREDLDDEHEAAERKSDVSGKRVSVRVTIGGRRR